MGFKRIHAKFQEFSARGTFSKLWLNEGM